MSLAHELGHWYYSHPSKLLLISQVHIFAILAFYPVFRHSPLFVRSFGFSPSVAANPPIIVSFLLYQVRTSRSALLRTFTDRSWRDRSSSRPSNLSSRCS